MKYTEANLGRIFILRLEHGDRIPDVIEQFARDHNVKSATVLFVGGSEPNSKVVVGPEDGTAAKPVPTVVNLPGVSESVGVGTIFVNEDKVPKLHMHSAFGRNEQTITGCTREGVVIWQIGEVIILELTNHSAQRKINPANGFELLEVQDVKNGQIDNCTKEQVKLEGIEKLLDDLSGDKAKEVVDSAIKELMQLDDEQVRTVLFPLIEAAVSKAAYESDFIWLAFIKDIVQAKGLEESLDARTSRLLNFEELLSGIQF